MNPQAIFAPFAGTLLLTLAVWVYMYARRIPFLVSSGLIKRSRLCLEDLARLSPPAVSNPSDNLKNLFELPVIFYAVVLYLVVTRQVDAVHVAAAWVFFAFRVLHSAVHCTVNHVLTRFFLYLVSSLALWLMVVRIALNLPR